jgi:beta-lactamase regulating signal transducer with metallopeptidase domain
VHAILSLVLGNALVATALAVVAAVVGRFCRRPAVRHGLWLLVLLKLLAPPFLAVPIPWPVTPAESSPAAELPVAPAVEQFATVPGPAESEPADDGEFQTHATEPGPSPPEPPTPPNPPFPGVAEAPPVPVAPVQAHGAPPGPVAWEPVVTAVWLAGSGLWLALAVRRLRRFRRLLRFARPAPGPLQQRSRRLAVRLGLRRCPGVWLVPGPISPMLWALAGPPRLLLPEALWSLLSADQQDALLAHELAHLRRGDHWVRRLELLALGLYWWHPAAWLARRELRDAEEQCCDAWVVWALPGAAVVYAAALVETVAFLSEARPAVPVGASAAGHVHRLKRRLIMIVRGTTPRGLGGAGLAAVMTLAALLLPLLPTRALTETALDGVADAPPVRATDNPREPVPATSTPAPKADTPAPVAPLVSRPPADEGQDAGDAIELAKAQLDLKVAELAEAKALLDKAKRQVDRLERLRPQKLVSEEEVEGARTDLTVQQARVQAKEAQVREAQVRLKQAERRPGLGRPPARNVPAEGDPVPAVRSPLDNNAFTPAPREKPAAPPDVEQRLRELEKKVDGLLKEMEALRRELKQRPGAAAPTAPLPPGPATGGKPLEVPAVPRPPDPRSTPTVPLEHAVR